MKQYEFDGKTVEEATENACRELKLDKSEMKIEIVESGSAGIFGLMGGRKAKIKVTVTTEAFEPVEESTPGATERPVHRLGMLGDQQRDQRSLRGKP